MIKEMEIEAKAKTYTVCTQCVMDVTDPDITFDKGGVCSHCKNYKEVIDSRVFQGKEGEKKLEQMVAAMKKAGQNSNYDCLIGVSGGVDSTYTAYLVKKMGLRPLAVHFDNGWNSELAVSNIEKVLKKLDIDLYTYVVNWEEFKELQVAFLRASIPDGEIPTDHAINSLLFHQAVQNNIKYIVTGLNFTTESIMPKTWSYGHMDWPYIKGIYKKFGNGLKLKTYPHISWSKLFYYTAVSQIKSFSMLNYIPYNKEEAIKILVEELGWRKYSGKHYESIYTRFFQSYILFRKFNIDKRKAHLSNLILSGQISRTKALEELKEPVCSPDLQHEDLDFTIKKFGLTKNSFEEIMALPLKTYKDYPNSIKFINWLKGKVNYLRAKGWYPK
jgi:N-acetyl sugar amidotransferase